LLCPPELREERRLMRTMTTRFCSPTLLTLVMLLFVACREGASDDRPDAEAPCVPSPKTDGGAGTTCFENVGNKCPGRNHCPKGSTWSEVTAICELECPDGTVDGFPCVLEGDVSTTLGEGSDSLTVKAHVQLEADRFDGCALSYVVRSGTVTFVPPTTDDCTYAPISTPLTSDNAFGKMMFGLQPAMLVASFGTYWNATATCGTNDPPQTHAAQIGGSWFYAAGVSVVRGDELVGSAPPPIPGGPSSTWKLVRN
jgi:hypothetical protein